MTSSAWPHNPGGRADGNRKQRGFRTLTAKALGDRARYEMLIDCRECGSRVSDEAQRCPHCGCRGPSGRYTYKQDGVEYTVNENALEECAKCGQRTKHRVIDSYWEIQGRGHVIAKNKTCRACGGSHLWRSDWEEQRREQQQRAEAMARLAATPPKPKGPLIIQTLLWAAAVILPPLLLLELWGSVSREILESVATVYWFGLFGTIGWKIGRYKQFSRLDLIGSVLLSIFIPVWGVIMVACAKREPQQVQKAQAQNPAAQADA